MNEGSGVIHWLRRIWDRLTSTLDVKQSSEIVASTTTPLAAGAEYGASEPFIAVDDSAFVQLQVESLQPYDATAYTLGTTSSGVAVQVSLDGSTVYKTFPLTTANNPPNESIYFDRSYPYLRFVYTNGATPQTEFYFATSKHYVHTGPPVRTVGSAFNKNGLSMTVRAGIFGEMNGSQDLQLVQLSPSGSFQVAQTDRPSELRDRISVVKQVEGVTADTIIHTVTSGYKFYLQSLGISVVNDTITTEGRYAITDHGVVKLPYVIPGRILGGVGQGSGDPTTFAEPIPFENNVRFDIINSASLIASVYIIGYEEPI